MRTDDVALTRTTLLSGGPSWAAEFPVDVAPITLDADLVLAAFPSGLIPSGTVLGLVTATKRHGPYGGTTDEVQTVTITGAPTGGTFTLTYSGQTTAAIAYNATAATVQSALEALSNIAPGDVVVTGSAGGPWTVTFAGTLADTNVAQLTSSGAGLTGGTSPAVAHATTTAGGADAVSDGREVAKGHLLEDRIVRAGMHVDAALYYKGRIFEDRLPAGTLLDANAKADLTRIRYDRVGG